MVIYIIAGVLLTIAAIDVFFSSNLTMKIFMFGVADTSRYDEHKFRIIHSIGCFIGALLIIAGLTDGRPLWFYLFIVEAIITIVLIFTITPKNV